MYNLYNTNLEKVKKAAYEEGRQAGFRAGYAAAQQQPAEKIEAAYEQGRAAAAKLQPVRRPMTPQEDDELNNLLTGRKNGCGY